MKSGIYKCIVLLVVCTLAISKALAYKAILSNDTTRWNYYRNFADNGSTCAYFCYSDTVYNSSKYKILYRTFMGSEDQNIYSSFKSVVGLVREDTLNGQFWVRLNDYGKLSEEILLMDLRLQVGDSANVYIEGYGSYDKIRVDSVYTKNNLKVIVLKDNQKYIEGVGSSGGFEGYYNSFSLLCKYNNSDLIYSTGLCYMDMTGDTKEIQDLFPKISQNANSIDLLFENEDRKTIKLYDLFGRNIFEQQTTSISAVIPLNKQYKGIYILKIENLANGISKSYKIVVS